MQTDPVILAGQRARMAAKELAVLSSDQKNFILENMAQALLANSDRLMEANRTDMQQAEAAGRNKAFLDRLCLTARVIQGMAEGLQSLKRLPDPLGAISGWTAAEGIRIEKVRVPLGVAAIIYEARPNVTADVAGICIKTGNASLLRGSSDALESNRVMAALLDEAAAAAGAPQYAVQLIDDSSREGAARLMRMNQYVDVLIPRGGAALIRSVTEGATVPVLVTGTGNNHLFVDDSADLEQALAVIENAKCQRPATCNALETLLIHEAIAPLFVPQITERLHARGVELRGCEKSRMLAPEMLPVTEEDYDTEFLDLILAVRIVSGLEEALEHIARYTTCHSEVILTNDLAHAERFTAAVDAAAVYVNASSRFTDGGQFGFGAEMGISTQKLHARGPIGLEEMCSYKYVVKGDYSVRK